MGLSSFSPPQGPAEPSLHRLGPSALPLTKPWDTHKFSSAVKHFQLVRLTQMMWKFTSPTTNRLCIDFDCNLPAWNIRFAFCLNTTIFMHVSHFAFLFFLLSWATPLIWRRFLRRRRVTLAVTSGSFAAMLPCTESGTTSARSRWGRSLSSWGTARRRKSMTHVQTPTRFHRPCSSLFNYSTCPKQFEVRPVWVCESR